MLQPSPPWESWMRFHWGDIGWSLHLCVVSGVHPIRVPSWDLSVVLEDLMVAPFEPLESVPERILTVKVTLFFGANVFEKIWGLASSLSARCVWTSPRVWSNWPYGLGLAMFPRFYLHRFALRWSHFTLSILLLLLQARMEGFTCSVLSELWRSMWTAPAIGGNLPSCWYVLVLAAMGLPHRSTEFLTGWGTLSRWLMRCVVFLHLSAFAFY